MTARVWAVLCVGVVAVALPLQAQRDIARGASAVPVPGDSSGLAAEDRGAFRLDSGRFTVVAYPSDRRLAQSLLAAALAADTFPGLSRPQAAVLIAVAPDGERFRAWAGASAPEWGAAVAFPALQRIVMQGARSGSDAGDPIVTLRHELAHLALAEMLGELPPRWFDEGYASFAAGEWGREQALATSLGLAVRGAPSLDELELLFYRGASDAELAYALAHRAVADLAALDRERGLTRFFDRWQATQSFELALRQAFGITSTGFQKSWQQQTRRRYGALAVITNLALIVGLFAVLLGPFVWQRRRRDRARLEALREAEAAQEEAQRRSVLSAMLAVEGAVSAAPVGQAESGPGATRPSIAVDSPSHEA